MQSINIKTENFKQNLYELINSSQLPIVNIYYVIQLIEKEIEKTYYGIINSELLKESGKQESFDLENQISKNSNKEEE